MPLSLVLLQLSLCAADAAPVRTLRVDFFHTGDASRELFSLERLVVEPTPWPGNPRRPLDDSGLGNYFFEVHSAATGALLYSRGYSSVYGEWEDTAPAKDQLRTFEESLRLPLPAEAVEVTLKKRSAGKAFAPVWSFPVNPHSKDIDTSIPPPRGHCWG